MNSFGRIFRITTFGESHGPAMGVVVDGCPSNMELDVEYIQRQLDRRRPGQSDITTPRDESDNVEVLSGVYEGKTLGTPIAMIVRNEDADSSKYELIKDTPRPGHADLSYRMRYAHVDHRGGGRASARETISRVAAGAITKKVLSHHDIQIVAYTKAIGNVESSETAENKMKGLEDLIDSNPVRALDIKKAGMMEEEIRQARVQGDSLGGVIECIAFNVPQGIGSPVFGKLSSNIYNALSSIPAVRGIEMGAGFQASKSYGSIMNDPFIMSSDDIRTSSNNCGGILGGITDGMPIIFRVAFKPTPSIRKTQKTINISEKTNAKITVEGRHDPCVVPRAVPVVESMMSMALVDQMLVEGHIKRTLK